MVPKSLLVKAKSHMVSKGPWSPAFALSNPISLSPLCPLHSNYTLARQSAIWGSWHVLSLLLGSRFSHLSTVSSHCSNVILVILVASPTLRAPLKNVSPPLSLFCLSSWHWSQSKRRRLVYLLIMSLPTENPVVQGQEFVSIFFTK